MEAGGVYTPIRGRPNDVACTSAPPRLQVPESVVTEEMMAELDFIHQAVVAAARAPPRAAPP